MASREEPLVKDFWKKARLPINATLQQAISNLNETSFQIALIVGAEGVFRGNSYRWGYSTWVIARDDYE